jgi:hypothetical protein
MSLTFALLWGLLAATLALMPQRHRAPAVLLLILAGIPLLGWVTFQNGPLWGMLALALGAMMLHWPARPPAQPANGREPTE